MVCEKVGMLPALNYVEEKNILDRPETRAFVRVAMVDVAVKQENTDLWLWRTGPARISWHGFPSWQISQFQKPIMLGGGSVKNRRKIRNECAQAASHGCRASCVCID
mmetsp:Transcript_16347/g.40300  ORF Transcript_16347/g.40300 Transcript_16347/m.40300 type:complete len:107 (+) Transcript_16347:49-369(+)